MKKIFILLVFIISTFIISGCSDSYYDNGTIIDFVGMYGDVVDSQKYKDTSDSQRFFIVSGSELDEAYIILDKNTGVQYLFRKYMNSGGMCILVDSDGKPLLYEESEDNK